MARRPTFSVVVFFFGVVGGLAEYCGTDKVPYGIEVHKSGIVRLLCSRPNCFEKHYSECRQRSESRSCPERNTWVGGIEKTIDGRLFLNCCEYPELETRARLQHSELPVRLGEFFEGEEKENSHGDVVYFDVITNISLVEDSLGEQYLLTVHRFDCSQLDEAPPAWHKSRQWPYWQYVKKASTP